MGRKAPDQRPIRHEANDLCIDLPPRAELVQERDARWQNPIRMVSAACQRMLTGLTLVLMPSETSARLTALSSVMCSRRRSATVGDCKRKG